MALDQTQAVVPYRRLLGLFTCVILLAVGMVWTWLSMRSVMDIGGTCAEGGPYVTANPCPGGTWMIALGIPMLVIAAMAGSALAMGLSAPNLLVPMWGLLFGSLGWNFLEYGAFGGDLVWGWIVCGVMFELMALPVLFLMVPNKRLKDWTPPKAIANAAPSARWWWPAYAGLFVIGGALGLVSFAAWS